MKVFHVLVVPLLMSVLFLVGILWTFYTGAPGYGGTMLAFVPALVFALKFLQSFMRHI